MAYQLICLAGPLQGQTFDLKDSLSVGRHPSNELAISQLSVSRHHCTLSLESDGFHLRDVGSLFGTFVNEQAVKLRLLRHGDLINVGESLFLFQNPDLAPEGLPASSALDLEEASTAYGIPGPKTPVPAASRPPEDRSSNRDTSPHETQGTSPSSANPMPASKAVENLVGETKVMAELRSMVDRVAPVSSTVLIDGESGCGKELVARVIHAAGPRAGKPFVAVNCATLSENLLESELFGHEKGAFTGALQQRIGQFERAHGGTLFLDEVGEIPLGLQAKLLRALQEREIERLGGRKTVKVDVRVLAATNRDLAKEVAARQFRDDLYYRLDVIRLTVPPLRKRRPDIPLLAGHFLHFHAKRLQRPPMAFSPEARSALSAYDWPGNVRELSNAVERAVVLAQGNILQPEDLPGSYPRMPTRPFYGRRLPRHDQRGETGDRRSSLGRRPRQRFQRRPRPGFVAELPASADHQPRFAGSPGRLAKELITPDPKPIFSDRPTPFGYGGKAKNRANIEAMPGIWPVSPSNPNLARFLR